MLKWWRALPKAVRQPVTLVVKAAVTLAVFYLLLRHEIVTSDGVRQPMWQALRDQLGQVELSSLLPFLLVAALLKFVGIFASMLRWQLLLIGQGIRFNLWHIVGSFLIGRFLWTFLPSTVGLDGYKLYDAARFSGKVIEPAAATAVEKVTGIVGLLVIFVLTLPLGYRVLGTHAGTVALATVPAAVLLVGLVLFLLFRPGPIERLLAMIPWGQGRAQNFAARVSHAAAAYRGRGRLLVAVVLLSLAVHFCTAAMYYFTALGIGAHGARFWDITFASSIQIVATVLSPTMAGEGVRELVQAFLLQNLIGTSAAVLSAALGFWAAEALTLFGAVFLWTRPASYRPRQCEVS